MKGSLVLIATITACLVAADVQAGCGGTLASRCLAYWNADAVFVGNVLALERLEVHAPVESDANATDAGDMVRFAVVEGFRGVSDPVVAIWNQFHAEAPRFAVGEKYFIYAHRSRDNGGLAVSGCGDTLPLAEAGEDLEYARWIRSGPSGGRVAGTVYHEQWDPERNESRRFALPAGITVAVAGEGRSWLVTPKIVGDFATFSLDVPLGTYKVTVHAPALLVPEDVELFEVTPPGRCYKRSIRLQWPGTLRGRVIDVEGRPVPRLAVVLISRKFATLRPFSYQWNEIVATDEHGEFVHNRLAPGEYLVGIHIDAGSRERGDPPFYYPGVKNLAESPGLKVTLDSPLDLGDFQLPVPVHKTLVRGIVLMADGTPALEATVRLWSERQAYDAPDLLATTNANGVFSIPGVVGRRYQVSAYVSQGDTQLEGSAHIVAGRTSEVVISVGSTTR
jgi:hypothetical protein